MSTIMNKALCNGCRCLVPATPQQRNNDVFLVKHCPRCGPNETLISSDARRYYAKRAIDSGYEYAGCALNCLTCRHSRLPSTVFVDVTNRCNMNCPICLNNTPSMGFRFDPPIEYFHQIFRRLSAYDPRPAVQLFGGEPTMREDLSDIIALAKAHGLRTRVVTNGIKLADEEYCRRLVDTGTILLISYDGNDHKTYTTLRGSNHFIDLKQKAIENVARLRRSKVGLISCIAKDLNGHQMQEILEFCHRHRYLIHRILLMPLAQTWDTSRWDYRPPRTTTEDIENLVAEALPGYEVDFLPAGFVGQFSAVLRYLRREPPPWAGAHANCESTCLLVSDGQKYIPIGHYLRGSTYEFGKAFHQLDQRLAARERKWENASLACLLASLRFQRAMLRLVGLAEIALFFAQRIRFGRLLKGRGLTKLAHAMLLPLELSLGCRTRRVLERHTNVQGQLQLVTLPFEDSQVLETDRLERCPSQHAYFNPWTDQVGLVPLCAWNQHKSTILRKVAEYYDDASKEHVSAPARPSSAELVLAEIRATERPTT